MALYYHLSAQIISRASGRSALHAACYRAGEKATSEYDGSTADYTAKSGIVYSEIILPENAPEGYRSRSALWNAVETAEGNSRSAKTAQLAREINVALPPMLSVEEQAELVREYIQTNFLQYGICCDFAIHHPVRRDDLHRTLDKDGNPTDDPAEMVHYNPHAHIMLTMRPVGPSGFEAKSHKEYVCWRGDEERNFSAAEFKEAQKDGWEKLYSYRTSDGRKEWMTKSQGDAAGLERTSRQPKDVKVVNSSIEAMNRPEALEEWRASWAEMVNARMAAIGSEERIDHRSYKRQGLDITPTLHMGPAATAIEKRADREVREGKSESEVQRSDIGNINRSIMEERRLKKLLASAVRSIERAAEQARKAAERASEAARTTVSAAARKLEHIRGQVIGLEYYDRKAADILKDLDSSNEKMRKAIDAEEHAKTVIRNAQNSIQDCEDTLKSGKPSRSVRAAMQTRISQCRDIIERQMEVLAETLRSLGFQSESEYIRQRRYHEQRQEQAAKMRTGMEKIHAAEEAQFSAYDSALRDVPREHEDAVSKERERIRPEEERRIEEKLRKEDGEAFSEERYLDALDAAARKLDETHILQQSVENTRQKKLNNNRH